MNERILRLVLVTVGASLAVALASAALLGMGRGPLRSLHLLQDPSGWQPDDPSAPVTALLALLAWGCVLWLAAALVVSAAVVLPGAAGRVADVVSRRIAPGAVRRLGRVAVGVTLVTGVGLGSALPASAAGPAPSPSSTTTSAATGGSLTAWGDLDWPDPAGDAPTTSATPTPAGDPPAASAGPTPVRPPASSPRAVAPTAAAPTAAPAAPSPSVALTGAAVPRASDDAPAEVVVVRGDTLWALAARHLGPDATDAEIAAEWQRWYAHNRGAIGDDPDLLLPGQRLSAPGA